MKLFLIVAVAAFAVAFAAAEDDGQYRPYLYGTDDGQYRPGSDSRFYKHFGFNTYKAPYARNVVVYQPVYTPYYQASVYRGVTPIITYNAQPNYDQAVYAASSLSPVTVTTARPIVYSVPVKPTIDVARYIAPTYARTSDHYANIIRQDTTLTDKDYHYAYQTDNGIAAEEVGKVAPAVQGGGTKAAGFYEHVGDDGKKYRVDYVADENGFQPIGDHLPKSA